MGHQDRIREKYQPTTPHPTTDCQKQETKKSISTQQPTIQKYHQAKFTLIKLEDFPSNKSVGTNT